MRIGATAAEKLSLGWVHNTHRLNWAGHGHRTKAEMVDSRNSSWGINPSDKEAEEEESRITGASQDSQ